MHNVAHVGTQTIALPAAVLEQQARDEVTASTLTAIATTVIAPFVGPHITGGAQANRATLTVAAVGLVGLKTRSIRSGLYAGAIVVAISLVEPIIGPAATIATGLALTAARAEITNPGFFRRWFRI